MILPLEFWRHVGSKAIPARARGGNSHCTPRDGPARSGKKIGLIPFSCFGSVVERFADRDFDKFSEPGAPHISKKMVLEDLRRLRDAGRKLEVYADRRVAHRDKREVKSPPLFRDGDGFITLLDKLYVKYHLLFHASSMNSLMPTYQYDWKEIFREPWIPSEPEESNESLNADVR